MWLLKWNKKIQINEWKITMLVVPARLLILQSSWIRTGRYLEPRVTPFALRENQWLPSGTESIWTRCQVLLLLLLIFFCLFPSCPVPSGGRWNGFGSPYSCWQQRAGDSRVRSVACARACRHRSPSSAPRRVCSLCLPPLTGARWSCDCRRTLSQVKTLASHTLRQHVCDRVWVRVGITSCLPVDHSQ